MEIVATGKQVGTWQAFVAKSRTVGTATNGTNVWLYVCFLHGKFCVFHKVDMRSNLFFHVVVAIGDGNVHCARAVFSVEKIYNLLEKCLFVLELLHIVVTNDVVDGCLLAITRNIGKVEKSFVAFGVHGVIKGGQQTLQFHCDKHCVDHQTFCRTGVHRFAVHYHFYSCSVKVFVFQLADATTVNGIGTVCTKTANVKKVGTSAHFFVRRKSDFDFPVGNLRILHQSLGKSHNHGNARFVVGTQKGCSVRADNGFAKVGFEAVELIWRKHSAVGKGDIFAVVVGGDNGFYVCSTNGTGRINVRDKPKFVATRCVCRDGCVNVAVMLVHFGIDAKRNQFVAQKG